GTGAGGATAFLDRVSIWRFLSPPPALLGGLLVDRDGDRVCDESRYGAALGDAIVRHGGRAWLLADRATLAEARRQVPGSTLWFQRLQAWYLLAGAVRAPTVAALAARAGLDPDRLEATLAAYNAAARDQARPDPAGQPAAAPATTPRRSHPFREPKQTTEHRPQSTDHMPAISQSFRPLTTCPPSATAAPLTPLRMPDTTATM